MGPVHAQGIHHSWLPGLCVTGHIISLMHKSLAQMVAMHQPWFLTCFDSQSLLSI